MSSKSRTHENPERRDKIKAGTDRAFGFVFAAVFAIAALWPLIDGGGVRLWAAALSVIFLAAALLFAKLLRPLNLAWHEFGLLLHKITTPLIMGLIFYTTLTPIALIMRATGKDPLNLKFDPDARSYWIKHDPPGPSPESMKNQF